MRTVILLSAFLASTAASGDTPMSAEEFQAYTEGKTLVFREGGMSYGAEQYLTDRRVKWAYSEDECIDGYWYQQGAEICFVYEEKLAPQCWTFYRQGAGLRAVFSGESGTELYEAYQSDEPLACIGPKIGA